MFCFVHVSQEPPSRELPFLFLVGKTETGEWRRFELPDLVDALRRLPEGSTTLPLDVVEKIAPDTLAPPKITDPRDGRLLDGL